MSSLQFLGPTFFSPLIQEATRIAAGASRADGKQKYSILLILTDGTIHDVDRTLEAIRNAAKEAISIVIIGVGEEDFSVMLELQLCIGADRDIVQFIRFSFSYPFGLDCNITPFCIASRTTSISRPL